MRAVKISRQLNNVTPGEIPHKFDIRWASVVVARLVYRRAVCGEAMAGTEIPGGGRRGKYT